MPPAPMAARISYGPRRAPGARLMLSRRDRRRRDRIEPLLQPRVHFLVEVTAVLAVQNPVIRPRPHQQAAGYPHPLQRAPVLERVVDGHPEIALADGRSEEHTSELQSLRH